MSNFDAALHKILSDYSSSFSEKSYLPENNDTDVLMNIFGITPDLKRENRQYWGRELGMCWQLLVTELFKQKTKDFLPGYRIGADELTDLAAGKDAIDTKYRIGSGDSGTLKKFKSYGKTLREKGFNPVLLILREDNLKAAITACKAGGWQVNTGTATFDYIEKKTGVKLEKWLGSVGNRYAITRPSQ